jgi:hypothetical protein
MQCTILLQAAANKAACFYYDFSIANAMGKDEIEVEAGGWSGWFGWGGRERGGIKGNGIPIQCSSLDVFSSLICQLPISVLKYCIQGPILPEQTHTRRRGDQVGALA